MQLVILAAGHGRRFGGLKQLAAVGPNDEAIMDFTATDALAAGFDGIVLVVREEVRQEIMSHVDKYWPGDLAVTAVLQGPIAGTAQAVASAAGAVEGPFGVANADDLYGSPALELLARELRGLDDRSHVTIGYRLADTVITKATVTRGICETTPEGDLVKIVEQAVTPTAEGFVGKALEEPDDVARELSADTVVSMNLWGFHRSIFDDLSRALVGFEPAAAPAFERKPPEVLLPSVVGELVSRKEASVKVPLTSGRCIGITHPSDLGLVRSLIAKDRPEKP